MERADACLFAGEFCDCDDACGADTAEDVSVEKYALDRHQGVDMFCEKLTDFCLVGIKGVRDKLGERPTPMLQHPRTRPQVPLHNDKQGCR